VIIEGEWWIWDEEAEVLRDKMGRERVRRVVGESGEGGEGRRGKEGGERKEPEKEG